MAQACFAAPPINGQYWQFAPCSPNLSKANASAYEANGNQLNKKGELYDSKTYRGELAKNVSQLLSQVLHQDMCISMIDSAEAIKNPTWWLLLPKPNAIFELENKKQPIHILKEISVYPNQDGSYCSSLVVKQKSPIYSMGNLKNKEIIISANDSTGAYLYPTYLLKHFFKENNIHFAVGKYKENTLERLEKFFNSSQYDESALLTYDYALQPYESKYRVLMKFCGLPDYFLISNDQRISEAQRNAISSALEQQSGHHISWVTPNLERLKAFFPIVRPH